MNIRFGILGLGGISSRFARVLQTMPGVELAAVAARDLDRARSFGQTFGAARAYDRYLDLIADPAVDAIYIGLIHSQHLEMVRQSLEHRKAVLCEKPLVTNRRDAETLAELSRANQTLLMEAMWTRCQPAYLKAREWVQTGKIGAPKWIQSGFFHPKAYDPASRFYDPAQGGGSLFDLGVYLVELASGLLGENPQQISGTASLTPSRVDEAAAFSLGFANGCLASLACGFTLLAPNDAVIFGSEGHIKLDSCYAPRCIQRFNAAGDLMESFNGPQVDGFTYQVEHFAGLYRQGKLESELIPLADTIACAGVFDELRRQWGL